ncbi:hypothetical protein [Leifsonia sp. Leaf336]|uniref:hypothetical protein n=1 Tax=Leifsonia sp. Leaf336 TaxID=1736341 RepID=UPI0012FAA251|nr:hypothetical protein [Leifsonia sp. Leaf336]
MNGVRATGAAIVPPTDPADWSDSNPPYAFSDRAVLTANWPSGTNIVPLNTSGTTDFYQQVINTVAAQGKRTVIQLTGYDAFGQPSVYHLNQFRLIGSSGDPTYAFGLWHSNLQGFLCTDGPLACKIQMDANSMTTAQLNAMASMTAASFAPLQMGMMRLDGSNPSSPILIAGVTFQAEDQQMLTATASDTGIVVPQPAPHQGIVLYYGAYSDIGYCRFLAAGRACMSAPPFEMANLSSARGYHNIHNVESDGRLPADLNPARPRRSDVIMGNNELTHSLTDSWLHHSNVSHYAVNDQNSSTSGVYSLTRVKFEHITDNQNTDPALNNGQSLGGWSNGSILGYESVNGTVNITDCNFAIDNTSTNPSCADIKFTWVGSRNPQGGRLHVKGGVWHHHTFPQLEGFFIAAILQSTYWWTDGPATTLDVRRSDNTPLTGYNVTTSWPPSAAQLSAAGVSPSTHYLYKGV